MDTDNIILEHFINKQPVQAAQAFEKLADDQMLALLEGMSFDLCLKLFKQINIYRGGKCLQLLNPKRVKELLENMDIPLAESFLRQCEEPFRTSVLQYLSPKLSAALTQGLAYEANTVGALMIPIDFAFHEDILVKEAISIIKREKDRVLSHIYIVNTEGILEGNLSLHRLFFAKKSLPIASIMTTDIPKLFPDMSANSIRNHPGWNTYRSIPVVDLSEKLLGILSFEASQISTTDTRQNQSKELLETSNSLGELYRLGVTGFLQSISK